MQLVGLHPIIQLAVSTLHVKYPSQPLEQKFKLSAKEITALEVVGLSEFI